jgi:hypothetical protein
MHRTLLTRFARTMVYQAPSFTRPDPAVLEALISKHNWQRKQLERDPDEFKDCCGGSASDSKESKVASELLSKDYKFRNFREAFAWMTKVAEKAEILKHHPEWSNVS